MAQTVGGVFQPSQDQQFGGGVLTDCSTSQLGVGYTTGSGGTVTQATNKSTAVTLNKLCGSITTNNASLANATAVGFTVTNNTVAATDVVNVCIKSGATANSYLLSVDAVAAGSFHLCIYNLTGGSLAEALVINFAVSKSVAS